MNYNVYECQDRKWISIGSLEPQFYANFCKAIGREDFIALQNAGPEQHREMIAAVQEIFKTKPRDEWVRVLMETDQCVAPVLEIDEVGDHPQTRERGMVLELDHPQLGKVSQPGFGMKLSDTPPSVRRFAPAAGQDTDSLLAALGYSSEQIQSLRESGGVS